MNKKGSGLRDRSVVFQGIGIAHSRALIRVWMPKLGLGVVSAVLCFVLIQPWGAESTALAWLLLQVSAYLARLGLGILNADWIAPPQPSRQAQLTWHAAFAGINGALWGATLFLFVPGEHVQIELLLAALLCTVIGLSTTSHYIHHAIKLAFLTPFTLLAMLWCIRAGDGAYPWIAAALPVACLALVFVMFHRQERHAANLAVEMQNSLLQRDNSLKRKMLEHEIEQRKLVENDLQRSRRLFMQGPVVTYRCSGEGSERVINWVSDNISNYGYEPDDMVGQPWDVFFKPVRNHDLSNLLEAGRVTVDPNEFSIETASGTLKFVYDFALPERSGDNVVSMFDGYFIDITRVHHAHNELAREKERAEVTLASIGDAVVTTDTRGTIAYMNQAAELLTGSKSVEMCGKALSEALKLRDVVADDWIDDPIAYYHRVAEGQLSEHVKTEYRSRSGEYGQLTYKVSPIHDGGPELFGYVLVLFDITHTEELQDELEYQARHDDLTGIYNRWEFENRFRMMLESSNGQDTHHMLMYLDLDQFKLVNDTCGHHAGDELLRQLTAIYGARLDNNAVLARLGGDEFGVLLESCSIERGLEIAGSLRDATRDFQFAWEGRVFEVGVSIGVVPVAPPFEPMHSLLGAADVACYAAKEQGRNHIRLHRDSDEELVRRRNDMDWASRLANSMESGHFSLYYQDIVPVSALSADGLRRIEILLRLNNEDGHCLSADHFLPSAERYNLMPDLDRWVIREAFRWFRDSGYPTSMQMNLNLSGLSFTNEGFLEFVEALFREYGVPPEAICFEVTETAAIQNLVTAGKFIQQLRQLGCRFALDDFGSGLSSFEYLKALPVDYLKIDGKFVTDISTNKVDRAVVDAINSVGHVMELKTIAEYVESDAILQELRTLNVDFAQGFGVGKPKPLNELALAS